MVEFGIVKFFDPAPDKRFGYLLPCTRDGELLKGKDVFFHYHDGGFVSHFAGGDGVAPCFSTFVVGEPRQLRYPVKGDMLVFSTTRGARGIKASPWSFASCWFEKEALVVKPRKPPKKIKREGRDRRLAHSGPQRATLSKPRGRLLRDDADD